MHPKKAAAFPGIGMTSVNKCQVPFQKLKGIAGRIYLRSELVDFIKKAIMAHIEHKLVPDGFYSAKDVERLIDALEKRIQGKEIMHTKEVAAFLGISTSKLYRLKNLPYHKLEGLEGSLYLRSELIELIKKH